MQDSDENINSGSSNEEEEEEEDINKRSEDKSVTKMTIEDEEDDVIEVIEEDNDIEFKHQLFHFKYTPFKYQQVFEALPEYFNNENNLSDFCDYHNNIRDGKVKILPYDEIYVNKTNLIKELLN